MHGTFKTIDDVISNFNLVGGMSLSFGDNRTDITIELKLYCACAERPTMIVNKSWFDKNVSNISVWGIK